MKDFQLNGQEYIELIRLLKLLGLTETGGEAKYNVEIGKVKVNYQIEYRKRCKLRSGDIIEFANEKIKIVE